ncbi:MAG: ribose-phosphate pyrophosphokinase [Armatimonadota bacterium]
MKGGLMVTNTENRRIDLSASLSEEKMNLQDEKIRIFSGNSHKQLAKDICRFLGLPLSNALVSKFSNEEIQIKIEESVRGTDVYVIQTISRPVNDNLMELLIMIDALSRSSAYRITAVVPHYGYAKQEKKTSGREPISAKLVANLITVAGADRVITVDLHAAAIQGFFDIPVDNLYAMPIIIDYYINDTDLVTKDLVIVAPDAGGVARARAFAEKLNASLAIVFKKRPEPDESSVIEIVGNVKGKNVLIFDDMISTGGTLFRSAQALIERGAKKVYACATHPVFANNFIENLEKSNIEELVITDTIPVNAKSEKLKILSVAPLLGEAIRRNHFNVSVSELFE